MGPNLLAGEPGFEPRLPDPESGVLPLDDSPLLVAPEHDKRAWLRCQVEGVKDARFRKMGSNGEQSGVHGNIGFSGNVNPRRLILNVRRADSLVRFPGNTGHS